MSKTYWMACFFLSIAIPLSPAASRGQSGERQTDTIQTAAGALRITPINHASLMIEFGGRVFHVDPMSRGDYAALPQADVILITDVHGDHMDAGMVDKLSKPSTIVVAPAAVARTLTQARAINNGEKTSVADVEVEAVPMYNLVRGPKPGAFYHDKGRGNGYVLSFGGTRVYISGDTECIPEMKALENIDVAFVCMNLPYTMTPQEAGGCVNAFRPRIVYPYHFGQSDLDSFTTTLQDEAKIEVRIRRWY